MKKVMTAALALSLLAGTSALAQSRGDDQRDGGGRRDGGGWSGRSDQARPQGPGVSRGDGGPSGRGHAIPPRVDDNRGRADDRRDDDRPARPPQPRPPQAQPPQARPPQSGAPQARPQPGRDDRGPGGWSRDDRPRSGNDNRGDRDPPRWRPGQDGAGDGPRRGDGRDNGWNGRDRDNDRNWDHRWDGRDRSAYRGDRAPQWRDRDRGRQEWSRDRWRPHYYAQQRYRAPVWRAPSGWYVRTWSFGDFLPWGWYDQQYYLSNYWSYGLPMPPVGCEWVRSGDDAILVDVWSGRVLSVYYNLFW